MAKARPIPISFTRISGIADYDKESVVPDSVAFARQIDFRTNPRKWKILPATAKESGSVITDLPVWGDRVSTDTYIYGDTGNIYKRTSAGSVTLLRSVGSSSGNGMAYFGEDDFLYYATDKALGRYGYVTGTPSFVDDFLTAEGGVPTNTYSLDLESGSSHYATAADSATLSITGDIAIEAYFKPESLPTAGNEMVLAAKWDKNSDERSYKFSVYAASGYFGDGSDGALTISSNTTEAPIDSACSGTSGTNTLSATNASFAANQIVLIHQSRGTGVGTWQRNKIISYVAGTITLENNLNYSYTTGAQVRVLKQYSSVTINSGITYTTKAWNGTVGGILAWVCSGTSTITGTASAVGGDGTTAVQGAGGSGGGFRGGAAVRAGNTFAYSGEGSDAASSQGNNHGNAGGGGHGSTSGGAGGGNGAGGANAASDGDDWVGTYGDGYNGTGGSTVGSSDLTTMVFGGGGGGGITDNAGSVGGGGSGGGIIFISATTLTITGAINANGGSGAMGSYGGGGGGAGGSILLKVQTATLGTNLVSAAGGGNSVGSGSMKGSTGGVGRIHLDYYTSYTGTTSPTLDATQDNSLLTNTTYQLRLSVSSNGTNEEIYTREVSSIATATWIHCAVSWDASASTATFMANGVSLGSQTGSFTAIYNSTALFTVGASLNASSAAENFADGKIDDIRLWASERTVAQILANKDVELVGTESGLNGYWQLDNSASDTTANANNLTLQNSPSYSTDVPFSAPTTRLDIDQQDTSTGNTYAVPQAIDEGASHRQSFVPTKDPQKSIAIYISDTGDDSDWTVTVHDALNREIASKTLTHAQLNTGHMEFIFSDVWRPVLGATYHFHVVASTSTGTPLTVSGTANNLETTQFKSYYQFLVEDDFHPIVHTGNFISVGNERYVATYDASTYTPHRLTFPSGWRVRSIAKWREYYAYGCMKGSSVSDYDQGIIFFWDGYSTTYNFFIEVPEGAINAMFGSQGTLYIVAGYQGDLLEYTGGDKATKVKRIPKITDDKYIEVLPGALSMWRTLLQIGAGVTDSSEIEQGVYSWGRRNSSYIDALSYDYKISTGTTQSTGVKIGLVLPVNKKLLIGWKDNVSYGLDSVNPAGSPYSSGSIEWMVRDEDAIWKEKKPDTIRADFDPLASGESVSLQYRLDRDSSWSSENTEDTDDETKLRVQPTFARHREYQIRLNLYTTGSTSPEALGLTIMEDALSDEQYV